MQISRAYKVELDPNNKQRTALKKHCGAARHVWNWGLNQRNALYEESKEFTDAMKLHKSLNALKKLPVEEGGKPWLKEVSKCAGQEALRDLDKAFRNFFRRCKQKSVKRKGFPRFKSRKNGLGSFRLTGTIKASESLIQLPKLGKIRLKESGYLPTSEREEVRILSATVKEQAGKWFVSLNVKEEVPDPNPKAKTKPVGIDVGISKLATLSDGTKFGNPRALKRNLRRLRLLQKSVSRKKKGSRNRKKAVLRLQRQHYRVGCIRKDALHKATSSIVKRFNLIGIETLNVSGMLRNHCLAGALSDASMAEFLRQIEYKSDWAGAEVVKVDRWYPSSKTCSGCGEVVVNLSLGTRVYHCESCGLQIDRDLNAAINLKEVALSSRVSACGEVSSGQVLTDLTKLP